MKSSGRKPSPTSYDEIFSTEASRQQEQIQSLVLSELHPFKDHPFRVLDDDRMMETVESVKEYGVLVPIIARPMADGGYEIVSGHRRKRACELAGLNEIPAIVRDLDDDEAVIIMVDSNLQRENILPSERAKAYQMKMEAMRRKAGRPSKENSRQVVGNFEMADVIGKETGESGRQVQRFIRLNNLEQTRLYPCRGTFVLEAGRTAVAGYRLGKHAADTVPLASPAHEARKQTGHAVGTGHHGNHDGEQADDSCQGVCRAAAGKADQVFSTFLHDGADGKGNFQAAGLLDAEAANVAGAIKTHETKTGYSADGHVSVRKHDFSLPNFRADKGGRRR